MEDHRLPPGAKIYRYKLDFYYQQALLYLITLLLYGGIRGAIRFEQMPSLESDPILYIIVFFVAISFAVLLLNRMRDRKLIVLDDRIIFHNKFHEREIRLSDIEWFHVGRELRVRTAGRSQVVVFKSKDRRRLFRIRIGRYERNRELLAEMIRIGEHLPKAKRRMFGGLLE